MTLASGAHLGFLRDRRARRPPRQRLRCVLSMFSSLEVKVLCPT